DRATPISAYLGSPATTSSTRSRSSDAETTATGSSAGPRQREIEAVAAEPSKQLLCTVSDEQVPDAESSAADGRSPFLPIFPLESLVSRGCGSRACLGYARSRGPAALLRRGRGRTCAGWEPLDCRGPAVRAGAPGFPG